MNCVPYYLLNLLLLAFATAIGAHELRANEIQAIIRGADQAFTRTFAEGFIRTWPKEMATARKAMQHDIPRAADRELSRSRQGDSLAVARQPESPRAGSAFAAPLDESVAAAPRKPNIQMPPAEVLAKRLPDVSPAEPAPTPAEQPRGVAMAKTQAQQQQSDATVVAPAQPPEKPSAEKAPNPRVARRTLSRHRCPRPPQHRRQGSNSRIATSAPRSWCCRAESSRWDRASIPMRSPRIR